MKHTLKYLMLVIVGLCTSMTGFAQFRYGPIASFTNSNLKFKQNIVTVEATAGFQAGVQAEMMFPGIGFGIDLGFIYNMAGAKVNLGERLMWASEGYGNENLILHQINLPFHLRFKFTNMHGLEETIAPFVYLGPDFHINVAHSKCDAMSYAGGDLGLTVGLGFEIRRHWQISGGYTWGMTYCLKGKVLKDWSARSRELAIRVAYLF